MKPHTIIIGLLALILLPACNDEPENESHCFTQGNPPRNSHLVTIEQGLWGDVWFWSGNFMPPGHGEICQVTRKVLIYELTTMDDVEKDGHAPFYTAIHTKLIASVTSENNGFFQIELEPGTYSIFVQEDGRYYANLFYPEGINPITIKPNELSELRFDITYEAAY